MYNWKSCLKRIDSLRNGMVRLGVMDQLFQRLQKYLSMHPHKTFSSTLFFLSSFLISLYSQGSNLITFFKHEYWTHILTNFIDPYITPYREAYPKQTEVYRKAKDLVFEKANHPLNKVVLPVINSHFNN